ncbi:MAG TPA: hypothetical protein VGJ05_18645 [Fimbriiglobus sp.]|jgi:N-acetylneuraminic acid mutarotase
MRTLGSILILLAVTLSAAAAEKSFPPLPEAITSFGATTCDGYVYVYGGHAGKTHSYAIETTLDKFRRIKIDAPSSTWEELPGGPHLQGLALVTYKGTVIRIGGMSPRNKTDEPSDSVSVAAVERFDPKVGKWANLPSLPAPRSSHDAVVAGDTLYVFGGWQMNGKDKKTVWYDHGLKLDLASAGAKWETVKQPFIRRALTVAELTGNVFVIGGLDNGAGMSTVSSVNVFDTKTQSWSKGPDLPGDEMNGFAPASVVTDGNLYLSPADGKVYRLAGKAWTEVRSLAKGRWVHRAVSIGDGKTLILGGASKGGYVAACEVVSLAK